MSEPRRGRVRSESARLSILDATAQLFRERGYDLLTMEGIAARAGVGKQTIYRWWPTKSALVSDCLLEGLILPDRLSVPNTGEVRRDILTWLHAIYEVMDQPGGEEMFRSLIAAAVENPDVGRRLHESLGVSSSLIERLQSAVDSSQLRSGAPLTEIGEALLGALILRALSRAPVDADATARLVDALLRA